MRGGGAGERKGKEILKAAKVSKNTLKPIKNVEMFPTKGNTLKETKSKTLKNKKTEEQKHENGKL